MKLMMKRSANPLVVLVLINSIAIAQTGNKVAPPVKTRTTVESTAKAPRSTADEMREQQLRVFREHVFARAVDNIKKMDEPGLRLSARNQILSYLASDKATSDDKQALATQIARDALTDLREHHEEIMPQLLPWRCWYPTCQSRRVLPFRHR